MKVFTGTALYSAIFSSIFFFFFFFFEGKKSSVLRPFVVSSSPFSMFIRSFFGFIVSLIDVFIFGNASVNPCTV